MPTTTNPPTLNPALRDFWLKPARNRILYGGRTSSKSWDAAGMAIAMSQMFKLKFLCTRQFQNKIEESVYTLLIKQIDRFGLRDQYHIINNKITHKRTGSSFVFYGLWRHIDEIKSLEGVDIHWAEEAHLMTEDQWKVIDPTVRTEGSQHWIIFNPRLVTDFVWKRFVVNPPEDTVVRKINYDENPFLSATMKRVIEAAKREDEEEFNHIYLGEPRTDDERVIIKRAWILSAIDAHTKLGITPTGMKRIGYDIADDGADMNATVAAHGLLATAVAQWKGIKDDILGSCTRVYNQARPLRAKIFYDCIGVGAMAGSKFKELNAETRARVGYAAFNAGAPVHRPDDEYQPGVTNREFFSNIKAQTWWLVADKLRNTHLAVTKGEKYPDDQLIAISPDCDHLEQLIDELSTLLRDFDAYGKVKAESKKDLATRSIKSPNLADAFVIAYNPQLSDHVDYGGLL